MIIFNLFHAFFTTGLFAFGGGLAIIPFLDNMVDKYHWFTRDDLTTLIALSEITPGALGVNMATYAGYMADGLTGAVIATIALVCPSVILVSVLFPKWQKIEKKPIVVSMFNSVKAATTGLIAAIFLSLFLPMFQTTILSLENVKILGVFIIALGMLYVKKIPMVLYLIILGILGILLH